MRTNSSQAGPRAAALEGHTLQGRYLIKEMIGEGGMAWVYRAYDQTEERPLAIKVMRDKKSESSTVRERFMREARVQSTLDHPHIVKVYDVFQEGDIVGLVQEWCDAGDLHHYLRKQSSLLPLPQIRSLFHPLLQAVSHAHANQLIHRDIKPANILLQKQNGVLLPKLNDFGLVKALDLYSLTSTGSIMGTVHYMAPEQFEETKHVDYRADIYSLGVLLYQMCTGRLPFNGRMPSLGMKILRTPPPHPKEATPALRDVLIRSLHKQPEARYPSCEAFEEAFLQAVQDDTLATSSLVSSQTTPSSIPIDSPDTLQTDDEWLHTEETHKAAFPTHTETPPETPVSPQQTHPHMRPVPIPVLPQDAPSTTKDAATSSFSNIWLALLLLSGFGIGAWATMYLTRPAKPQATTRRAPAVRPAQRKADRRPALTKPQGRQQPHTDKRPPMPVLTPTHRDTSLQPPLTAPLQRMPQAPPLQPDARPQTNTRLAPTARPTARPTPNKALLFRQALLAEHNKKHKQARALLARSCKLSFADACGRLGWLHILGKGGPKDIGKGIGYFRLACRRKYGKACRQLARIYSEGKLRQKASFPKARRFAKLACIHRDPEGCVRYGFFLLKGMGGKRDPIQAEAHFQFACEQNQAHACANLSHIYLHGLLGGKKQYKKARVYASKGCKLGSRPGCGRLAHLAFKGLGGKKDLKLARRSYKTTCELKSGAGCFMYAGMLRGGYGGPKNARKARQMAKVSCAYKDEDGCHLFARYVTHGIGGPRNCALANRYYQKACKLGEKTACREFCINRKRTRRQHAPTEESP